MIFKLAKILQLEKASMCVSLNLSTVSALQSTYLSLCEGPGPPSRSSNNPIGGMGGEGMKWHEQCPPEFISLQTSECNLIWTQSLVDISSEDEVILD